MKKMNDSKMESLVGGDLCGALVRAIENCSTCNQDFLIREWFMNCFFWPF